MRLHPGQFFGRAVRKRLIGGFTLTEVIYPPGSEIPRHSHELAQFCFIKSGMFREKYGGRSRAVRPCTVLARPSGEIHSHSFDAGAHCLVLEVASAAVRQLESAAIEDSCEFSRGILPWLGERLYREFTSLDTASELAIEGIALEMFAENARHLPTRDDPESSWLGERASIWTPAHWSASPCSTSRTVAHVHPVHLARMFRRKYHCSIGEYVRRLRINYACRAMTVTDSALTEIALAAGFYDQSHFTRAFKKVVGMTPTQYRAALRPR